MIILTIITLILILFITHFPSNLGKGVENTKEELLKKANEMKTKTEKFAEITKELFKDIDKDVNKYKEALKEKETEKTEPEESKETEKEKTELEKSKEVIEVETNKYNLSQMYSNFKPIKHISKETADLLIEINQGRENVMTINEIKNNYHKLGKEVEAHKNVMQAFEKYEKIIKGLSEASADYKNEIAKTKAVEMEKVVKIPEMEM